MVKVYTLVSKMSILVNMHTCFKNVHYGKIIHTCFKIVHPGKYAQLFQIFPLCNCFNFIRNLLLPVFFNLFKYSSTAASPGYVNGILIQVVMSIPLLMKSNDTNNNMHNNMERSSSVVECRTRNRESPGSNPPLLPFRRLGIFRSIHRRPCSLSCINEYLAIDSGGHVSDLVLARNCCLVRMLPGEAENVVGMNRSVSEGKKCEAL